jgi:hypothetical protein
MEMKKKSPRKYDPRQDYPVALFNWMILLWFTLFMAAEYLGSRFDPSLRLLCYALVLLSALFMCNLALKGTRLQYYFNPRTDPYGWVMRTGSKMKTLAKKLRYNYPQIIKMIRLKDTLYKVRITRKYRYHPNPITIEEKK